MSHLLPPPPQEPGKALPLALGAVAGAMGLPVLVFLGVLVGETLNVFGFVWLAPLVVPLAGVGLLVADRTRWWGAGVLIGFFGMLIIGAGACVLLFVGVMGGFG